MPNAGGVSDVKSNMLLRDGDFYGSGTTEDVLEMANEGRGGDPFGRRDEFIGLVKKWAGADLTHEHGMNHNDVFHGGVKLDVSF